MHSLENLDKYPGSVAGVAIPSARFALLSAARRLIIKLHWRELDASNWEKGLRSIRTWQPGVGSARIPFLLCGRKALLYITALLAAVSAAAVGNQASGDCGWEFSAEGSLRYTVFALGVTNTIEQEDVFSMRVKGNKWHILSRPTRYSRDGKSEALWPSTVYASDGTNFYQVSSLEGAPGVHRNTNSLCSTVARVGSGSTPFNLTDPKIIMLWYALGSSCYFSALDGRMVTPPTVFANYLYAKDFRVKALWQLQTDAPHLPQSIVFDGIPASLLPAMGAESPEFSYTQCVYSVRHFTRAKDLSLPSLIDLHCFTRNPTNLTSLIPSSALQIVVRSARVEPVDGGFTPEVAGRALVTDMRTISDQTPFGVSALATGSWPRIETSERLARTRRERFTNAFPVSLSSESFPVVRLSPHRFRTSRRWLVWPVRVTLALAVLLPIILASFRKLKIK